MRVNHFFFDGFGLGGSSTASFGTCINFFMRSENFPNPRGFFSGVSLAILLLLLLPDTHESRIAYCGELPVGQAFPHNSTEEQQEPSCIVQLSTIEPKPLFFAVAEEVPRSDRDVSPLDRSLEQ